MTHGFLDHKMVQGILASENNLCNVRDGYVRITRMNVFFVSKCTVNEFWSSYLMWPPLQIVAVTKCFCCAHLCVVRQF